MTRTTTIDPVLDTLIRARALISEERHWCRYTMTDIGPDGERRFCIRGAIAESMDLSMHMGLLVNHRDFMNIDTLLAAELPPFDQHDSGDDVPYYNNDPDVTHADVLALFDRAIDRRATRIAKEAA